jgi:hypothetical protein
MSILPRTARVASRALATCDSSATSSRVVCVPLPIARALSASDFSSRSQIDTARARGRQALRDRESDTRGAPCDDGSAVLKVELVHGS